MSKGLVFIFSILLVQMLSVEAFAKAIVKQPHNLLKADKIYYDAEEDFAEAIGNVYLLNGDQYISASRALIDIRNKKIWAYGPIYGQTPKQKMFSGSLFLDETNDIAVVNNARLLIGPSQILIADFLVKKNEYESEVYNGSYTPCSACLYGKPIWQIDAQKTSVDFKEQTITYHKAAFKIGGFKIVSIPYFSHALPQAQSKSGILRPEIEKGTLKIPFYYTIKPNVDLTYSPRFNKNLLIHEAEFRHLIENGSYQLNSSYTHSRIITPGSKVNHTSKKLHRYNINTIGNFSNDHLYYGFNLGKVSDKAYLKNYYQDHRSYIKSEIYVNHFQDDGYYHIDTQHYQGLRSKDHTETDPNALPNFDIRRDYELDSGWKLKLQDKAIIYVAGNTQNISRNSLDFEINKTFFGEEGQSLAAGFHNRADLYSIERSNNGNLKRPNKSLFRNIPELQSSSRWPLFISSNSKIVVVEPEVNLVIGQKNSNRINKYNLIDSPNYDINEHNIFENSRYSGIDFYEFGTRFSYGINNYVMGNNWQMGAFIGQLMSSERSTSGSKSDYVGKLSYNYGDNFELYYRFQRKNKEFKPYRDEIAAWINLDNMTLYNSWTHLTNLKEYSSYYNVTDYAGSNTLKQNFSSISYNLTDNLTIFGDLRLNLSEKEAIKVISDSIGTTYSKDCIAITLKIYNDYTSDPERDIKKTKSIGIRLGLKTINM